MTARRLQNGSNRIDTPHKLAGELANRYLDFHETIISSCYVIYLDKAAILTVEDIPTNSALKKGVDKEIRKQHIISILD